MNNQHRELVWLIVPLALASACSTSSSPSPSYGDASAPANTAVPEAAAPAEAAATAKTVDVTVGMSGGLRFSPSAVNVHPGDTVRWTWAASGHSVTSGTAGTANGTFCSTSDASCSSGALSPSGTVYTHTFASAGTFPYFCAAHFSMGMTGTITVQ